jgi:hypothetical protein
VREIFLRVPLVYDKIQSFLCREDRVHAGCAFRIVSGLTSVQAAMVYEYSDYVNSVRRVLCVLGRRTRRRSLRLLARKQSAAVGFLNGLTHRYKRKSRWMNFLLSKDKIVEGKMNDWCVYLVTTEMLKFCISIAEFRYENEYEPKPIRLDTCFSPDNNRHF